MKAHKLSRGSQGRKIFKGFVATWPGKGRPGQRFRLRHPRWGCRLAAFAGLVGCAVIPSLLANPTGESVRHGQATFTRSGSNLIIEQGSDKLVVNWKDFSISSTEITKFIQPGYPTIWGLAKSLIQRIKPPSMHAMSQNLESEPASLSTAHRVLLADSDPIYLRGLRASLAGGFVFNRPPGVDHVLETPMQQRIASVA